MNTSEAALKHTKEKTIESRRRKYEGIGKIAHLRKKYNLLKKTQKQIREIESEGFIVPDSLGKEEESTENECEILSILRSCLKISKSLKSHYSVKKLKEILDLELAFRFTCKRSDEKVPKALKKLQKEIIKRISYLTDVTEEVTVNSETSSESGSSESESESEPEETNNAGKKKVNNSAKKQTESDEIQVLEEKEDDLDDILEIEVDTETHSSLNPKAAHVEKTPSHSESIPTNDKTERIITIRSAGDLTSEELKNKVKTHLNRSKKREAEPEKGEAPKRYKPTKIVYEEKTEQKRIPSPRFLPEHRSWQQKSKRSSNNSVTEKYKNVTREKEKELSDKNVTEKYKNVTRKTQNSSQNKQDRRSEFERENRKRIEEERYYKTCAYFNYRDWNWKENPMYENRRRKYY